jgi:hypothetical protein
MLMLRSVEKDFDFLLNETKCNLKRIRSIERKLTVETGDNTLPPTSSS